MAKKTSKLPTAKYTGDCPSPVAYKQSKEDLARERRYKAEDAMRTITRAEEIKNDTRLMNDVKELAKEQMSNLKKFAK